MNKYGQTLGKRLLKIRMVRPNGERASLKALTLRIAFSSLLGIFPSIALGIGFIPSLLDILMIFSSNRRCLHDYIAGTIVVKVENSTPEN